MGSDITRLTFDYRKQYVGVVKQQGRVTLDADDNEGLDIALDSNRRDNLGIIGPCGAPDDGFSITNPRNEGGSLNFDISAGTMYVSGIRYLLEEAHTSYLHQPDWWRNNAQEGRIDFPEVHTDDVERIDLVYLMLWHQDVSATEDADLLEVALGGVDTAARRKTFARVLVLPSVQEDVSGNPRDARDVAWEKLGVHWQTERRFGTLTETGEITTDVRLTVDFDPTSTSPDLCSPVTQGGYLGAANQAMRVQIVGNGSLIWGFDNASALYRVRLRGTDRKTIDFDTVPRDEFHHPRPGQVVEVLPWSAALANGEKLAALTGHLTTVEVPYNPNTKTLRVADPYPGQLPVTDADGNALTLYLRVWEERLPFTATASTPVKLGATGIQVTLRGTQFRAGDYWTIGVRPATSQTVYPERLLTGKAPDGTRYFACPLAFIVWEGEEIRLFDCRAPYNNLVELTRKPKRIFVDASAGQTIRQALEKANPGDTIYIRGVCTETVTIAIDDLTLMGEPGEDTMLDGQGSNQSVITVDGARRVTIRRLTVRNGVNGILARQGAAVILERVVAQGNSERGFLFTDNTTAQLTFCRGDSNGSDGILVTRSSSATFHEQTTVDNNGARGVFADESSLVRLLGGTIISNNRANETGALHVSRGSHCTISGPLNNSIGISNNTGIGISVVRGSNVNLDGGIVNIEHNALDGILVTGHSQLTVMDVTDGLQVRVANNGRDGIVVSEHSSAHFQGVIANESSSIQIRSNVTGEGIAVLEDSFLQVENVAITGNGTGLGSDFAGSGINVDDSSVVIRGSTISGNGFLEDIEGNIRARFGSRLTLDGNTIPPGTIHTLDRTVLARGDGFPLP